MIPLRFTEAEMDAAHDAWGANCGPAAVAAVCGLTLDEVRPHLGDFEDRRYTNPTLMWAILRSVGVPFQYRGGHLGRSAWPAYGLARVQWEGPWTRATVPERARYRYTHWVGARRHPEDGRLDIFDANAMAAGGWVALDAWATTIVPWIMRECVPRADGGWHLTHIVEVGYGRIVAALAAEASPIAPPAAPHERTA